MIGAHRNLGDTWPGDMQPRKRATLALFLTVGALLALSAGPVLAFKWSSCPTPPPPVYPSDIGATNAPFIHPGHFLTIVLNDSEVALTGGFSLDPDGNDVAITFISPFGAPISLAPRTATATALSVLTFDFPDTQNEGLGILTGPVDVSVTVAGVAIAHIRAADLVALPPASDVTSIVLGGDPDATVLAALGADGDIWVPAGFSGHPMSMPGCPGDFIMPAPIMLGGATVAAPLPTKREPLERIHGVEAYLGDMNINGVNFYGMPSQQPIDLVHTDGTLGVALCRMNDALNVVLRVKGNQSWVLPQSSPFRFIAAGARPIPLHLTGAPLTPGLRPPVDSFGNPCVPGAHQ